MDSFESSLLRVIGIGSPFGDDRLGWEVIKRLEQDVSIASLPRDRLDLVYYDRPGAQLLEWMKGAKTVFIIDAIKMGYPLGSIHCFKQEAIEAVSDELLSSHSIGIGEVMTLGRHLSLLPENIVLYGIEIDKIPFQFELSDTIKQAINELLPQLISDIKP